MTILRDRYHDVENEMVATSSGLLLIEDALKAAKAKNQPIDIEKLRSLINTSIAHLQEVEKGLSYVKRIAYKVCDSYKDHDNLIFLKEDKKILIADSDHGAIEALTSYFLSIDETRAAKIFFTTNIEQCLEVLEKEKPSLMFLDATLDHSSSLGILKNFKDKLKIVVLSKNIENKQRCLDEGVLTFIIKPLPLQTYVKVMLEHA